MRRWIAGAAAGLGLLLAAPVVARADGPQWDGSRITSGTSSSSSSFAITAQFVRTPTLPVGSVYKTWLTIPGGLDPLCGAAGPKELATPSHYEPGSTTKVNTTATATAPCNGTYTFEVTATVDRTLSADDVKTLRGSITVSAPPPEVTGVNGSIEGSTVVLSWSSVSNRPPDFTGYIVQRQQESGEYTTIATLGASATTFTDTSPPPEGGETVYRVLATRTGPNGDVTSDGGGRTTVSLPVATTTSMPGGDTTGGATDGGTAGTGSTAGTVGTDSGAGTGGTTVTTTPRRGGAATRGRTGIGTRAPRLGLDTGNSSGLLINPDDEGFDEEIDYGDQELAGEEGAGNGLEIFEEEGGRGLAVPIGIGAVLFGWGLHLFLLARAARPEMMPVPADDGYGYGYDDQYEDVYGTTSHGTSGYGSSGYGTSSYGYSTTYSSSYDDDGW